MDLKNLMPLFGKQKPREKTEAELDTEDAEWAEFKRRNTPKNGPRKVSFMTTGQVRRMQARDAASQHRKGNRRYRKAWLATEQRYADLRGQIGVATGKLDATPASRRLAIRGLEREHGSVAEAVEFFDKVSNERAANSKQAQAAQAAEASRRVRASKVAAQR